MAASEPAARLKLDDELPHCRTLPKMVTFPPGMHVLIDGAEGSSCLRFPMVPGVSSGRWMGIVSAYVAQE
eukprot:1435243-Prymnesium_polylepis.2